MDTYSLGVSCACMQCTLVGPVDLVDLVYLVYLVDSVDLVDSVYLVDLVLVVLVDMVDLSAHNHACHNPHQDQHLKQCTTPILHHHLVPCSLQVSHLWLAPVLHLLLHASKHKWENRPLLHQGIALGWVMYWRAVRVHVHIHILSQPYLHV